MSDPVEPFCPPGRRPHHDRVADIDSFLGEGQTAAVAIDDTEKYRVWYLHEIAKYPRLKVVSQGVLTKGVYIIKVRKEPSNN